MFGFNVSLTVNVFGNTVIGAGANGRAGAIGRPPQLTMVDVVVVPFTQLLTTNTCTMGAWGMGMSVPWTLASIIGPWGAGGATVGLLHIDEGTC